MMHRSYRESAWNEFDHQQVFAKYDERLFNQPELLKQDAELIVIHVLILPKSLMARLNAGWESNMTMNIMRHG